MNMRIIEDITNFIFIEDKLEHVDDILIPGGSFSELPEQASRLWKKGYAPYIIPTGKYSTKLGRFAGVKTNFEKYNKNYETECEFYTDVLVKNGVNERYIIRENESMCTADNARFTKKILEKEGIQLKKAIICCKAFHARRCLMFYQFSFPDTKFIVIPVVGQAGINISRENWYKTELGQSRVFGELSRLGTQFVPEFQQFKSDG